MSDHLSQLCNFLCETSFDDLPPEVIDRARLVTADTLAAIAAGSAEPEMRALTSSLLSGSVGTSSVIGTGHRAAAPTAAFLNASAGTFLELDEGNRFSRGHPGIHALPAAFAHAEATRSTGKSFLLALVLGYEVGVRIAIGGILKPSVHPHGTWGTVAAAVAVAKIENAEPDEMRQVINVASSLGLANSIETMLEGGTVRNTFAGFSGQIGNLVWQLVQSGFSGEADGLASVWGKVLSDSWNPAALTDDLGQRWEILRNYFKRHACCRYNHGALDVLAALRNEHRFEHDDIEKVEVATYAIAARLGDQSPKNTLAAKFSVPFSIATTLVRQSSGVESFTREALGDETIRKLCTRVTVREDQRLSDMFPGLRPARVEVILKDGRRLEGYTETNRGDDVDPYPPEELAEKFFELTDRVWPREVAETMHRNIMALDGLEDISRLVSKKG